MSEFFKKITKGEIRNLLAVIITLGCFAQLIMLQYKAIPAENKDIVNIAVGFVFGGALAGVVGFFFGASKTDADKTRSANPNPDEQ